METRPKSPEELQGQFEDVQIFESLKSEGLSLDIDPRDEIFKISQEELRERLEGNPELTEQYSEYVTKLRELRKETRDKIRYGNRLDSEEPGTTTKVQEPVYLYEKALSRLQGNSGFMDERFFSDEEAQQAGMDRESFKLFLKERVIQRPSIIFKSPDIFRSILSKDELKQASLNAMSKNPHFMETNLEALQDLFSDEEIITVVNQLLNSSQNIGGTLLNSNLILERLPDDMKTMLAHRVFENTLPDHVDSLISKGVIEADYARDVFLKSFSKGTYINGPYNLDQMKKYFELFKGEKKEELVSVIEKMIDAKDFSKLFRLLTDYLKSISEVAGEEWRDKLIEAMLDDGFRDIFPEEEYVISCVGKERFLAAATEIINGKTDDLRETFITWALKSKRLSDEQKMQLAEKVINGLPFYALNNYDLIKFAIPDDERSDFLRQNLKQEPRFISNSKLYPELFEGMSEEERNSLVRDLIININSFSFIESYVSNSSEYGKTLRNAIPENKIGEVIVEVFENGIRFGTAGIEYLEKIGWSKDQLKELLLKLASINQKEVLNELPSYSYLFSSEEVENLMLIFIEKDLNSILDTFSSWKSAVSNEFVRKFVLDLAQRSPDHVLQMFREHYLYFSEEESRKIYDSLARVNPFLAVSSRIPDIILDTIDKESFIKDSKNDDDYVSLAPKTITELLSQSQQELDVDDAQRIFEKGARLYLSLNQLKKTGLDKKIAPIIEKEQLSQQEEVKLISVLHALVVLQEMGVTSTEFSGNTSEDINNELRDRLKQIFPAENLSDEQYQQAIESFGGPEAIILYIKKHFDHPEIMQILQEVFQSAGEGGYKAYRFELDTAFDQVKKEGRLPSRLTQEQYDIWVEDNILDIRSSLESTSKDIASVIRSILQANIQELGSNALAEHNSETTMENIKSELKELGGRIAELGKSLAQSNLEGRSEIKAHMEELKKVRQTLVSERDILRLAQISAEEINQGQLITKGEKKPAIRLHKFISQLRELFPESQNIFDEIESAIVQAGHGGQRSQNLETTDSADLDVCFHIGENPVHSCQHYDGGGYNESLMAYISEANTKVSIVKNEKENIIGRRVTRLLQKPDGVPVIFLETKYASTPSGAVDALIFSNIYEKANQMGIDLYIGSGELLPDGFQIDDNNQILESKGGRAPYVYVDSAGGERKKGVYAIGGAKKVIKL